MTGSQKQTQARDSTPWLCSLISILYLEDKYLIFDGKYLHLDGDDYDNHQFDPTIYRAQKLSLAFTYYKGNHQQIKV